MRRGDLVTFCPEAWGTPLEDRPLGVIMNVETLRDASVPETYQMVTVSFAYMRVPYSSKAKDFEVVNEDW